MARVYSFFEKRELTLQEWLASASEVVILRFPLTRDVREQLDRLDRLELADTARVRQELLVNALRRLIDERFPDAPRAPERWFPHPPNELASVTVLRP